MIALVLIWPSQLSCLGIAQFVDHLPHKQYVWVRIATAEDGLIYLSSLSSNNEF